MSTFQSGQITELEFEGRKFEVIVIDPDGLGEDQPSVGFGFRMMERHAGLPESTLSDWATTCDGEPCLQLPSGSTFRIFNVLGTDGNNYSVVEATDWFEVAFDVLEKPGRVSKGVKSKLLAFLRWFAIKGFYAEAYVAFKGVYTQSDSRATSRWLQARFAGVLKRNQYTDLLKESGCVDRQDYAYWTDYVYIGLFNMQAWEMKKEWKLIAGDPSIGRNHVPEARGLEAIAFCEEMVVKIFAGDLQEAHDDAIRLALRKYVIEG